MGIYIIVGIFIVFLILFLISYLFHNSIFGKRFIVDPKIRYYTKEEYNLNAESIHIKCKKETLVGSIYSYDNPKKNKIIIFAHGMFSSTKAYIQEIEYLCRNGYLVVGFDYIGTDLSSGKSLGSLSNGIKSLDYAIRYIKEEYKNYEIILVGHSWGAYNCLNVTMFHPDICCVVASSPFASMNRLLKGMLPKILWWMIIYFKLIEFLKAGKYSFTNSKKALKRFKGKVLILHSIDDSVVKYKYNTQYLKNKFKDINYIILNDRAHNPTYTTNAVKLLGKYADDLKKLEADKVDEYKDNTDYHRLGELDDLIMNKIVKFIEE